MQGPASRTVRPTVGNGFIRSATGTLGTPTDTVQYTYADETWGDLLTGYDGTAITYDGIGNPNALDGWSFTWEHGRELVTMSDGTATWTNTYSADGLRTKRTNGSTTYSYVYTGSTLLQMTVGSNTLYFNYDAAGIPLTVTYNNVVYYYATNLQGDVVAILDSTGAAVVTYTYDAWGNPTSTTGTLASTLGTVNPLRYRGYVYDIETGLYYLQTRYYNPKICRFLNADGYTSTGQGFTGRNVFVYCANQPVVYYDSFGTAYRLVGAGVQGEFDAGCFTAGFEVILYWDEDVCGESDLVVAVYGFGGSDMSFLEPHLGSIVGTIIDNADSIISTGGATIGSLFSGLSGNISISGSAVAVMGNEYFTSPIAYAGPFSSFSGSFKWIKGSFAYSDKAIALAIGAVVSKSVASLGASKTNYKLYKTIPINFKDDKSPSDSSRMQYYKKHRGLVE